MRNKAQIEKIIKKAETLKKINWILLSVLMIIQISLGIFFIIKGNLQLGVADLVIAMWIGIYAYSLKNYYDLWKTHDKLWDDYFELSERFLKFMKDSLKRSLDDKRS